MTLSARWAIRVVILLLSISLNAVMVIKQYRSNTRMHAMLVTIEGAAFRDGMAVMLANLDCRIKSMHQWPYLTPKAIEALYRSRAQFTGTDADCDVMRHVLTQEPMP